MSAQAKRGAHVGGRTAEAEKDREIARGARAKALAVDLRALLARLGPSDPDDLRDRLCVASRARFDAAVRSLVRGGICKKDRKALRLADDARAVPKPGVDAWYRARGVAA